MIGKDAIDALSRDDGSSDVSERENNDNVLLTTPSSAKVIRQKAFDFVNVAGFDDDGRRRFGVHHAVDGEEEDEEDDNGEGKIERNEDERNDEEREDESVEREQQQREKEEEERRERERVRDTNRDVFYERRRVAARRDDDDDDDIDAGGARRRYDCATALRQKHEREFRREGENAFGKWRRSWRRRRSEE